MSEIIGICLSLTGLFHFVCSPGPSILSQRISFLLFLQPSKCPIVVLSTHLVMDIWAGAIIDSQLVASSARPGCVQKEQGCTPRRVPPRERSAEVSELPEICLSC